MKRLYKKILAVFFAAVFILSAVPLSAAAEECPDAAHEWSGWSECSETLDSRICAVCGRTEYKYSDSCTVLSLNLIEQTDGYIAVGVALERGSFIALDVQVTFPQHQCLSIRGTNSFLQFEKDVKRRGETVITSGNVNNGMYSISTMISYGCLNENFVEYRFAENGETASPDDIELTVRRCYASDTDDAFGNISEPQTETFSRLSSDSEHIHIFNSEINGSVLSSVCSECGLEEYGYISSGDAVFGINIVEDELFYTVFGVSLEAGSFNSVNFNFSFLSDLFGDIYDLSKTEFFDNYIDEASVRGDDIICRLNSRVGRVQIFTTDEYSVYGENIITVEVEKLDMRDVTESDIGIEFVSLENSDGPITPDTVKNFSDSVHYTHIFTPSEVIPVSCTEDGQITYICRCGEQLVRNVTAEGHRLQHFVDEPTCENDGYEYDECTECRETFNSRVIPAKGHDWSEWSAYESGRDIRTCLECGKTELRYPIDSAAMFSVNVLDENDEYAEIGIAFDKGSFNAADVQLLILSDKIGECIDYGTLYLEEFAGNVSEHGGSCVYSISPRSYKLSAGTTQPYSGCEEILAYFKFNKLSPESITEDDIGLAVSSCRVFEGNQLRDVECYVAVMTLNEAEHTHLYHQYAEIPETCTEEGLMRYTCMCGDSFTAVIPAGHSILHVNNPAGCETDGEEYDICTRCSEVYNYCAYPATGHSFEHVITQASCVEDGRECDLCRNCQEERNLIITPAYGHDWGNWTYLIKTTCTANGYKFRTCRTCHDAEGTVEEAFGHTYSWNLINEPSETENAQLSKKCERCGNVCDELEFPYSSVQCVHMNTGDELSAETLGFDGNLIKTYSEDTVISLENGTVRALKPGTVYILSEDADGQTPELYRIDVEGIIAKNGSVIDYDRKLIYGLDLFAANILSYVETTDSSLSVSCGDGILATGSRADVIKDGIVIESYEAVIFGDVNGDGKYDGTDAVITSCIACGMLSEADVGSAVWFAADCNHDGVTDSADVSLLNEAGLLLSQVDQSKNPEELLSTSSVFAEYIGIIDQGAIQETEDVQTDEGLQTYINIFTRVISVLKKVIEFIVSALSLMIK